MKSIAVLLLAGVIPVAAQWVDDFGARVPGAKGWQTEPGRCPAPRVNGEARLYRASGRRKEHRSASSSAWWATTSSKQQVDYY